MIGVAVVGHKETAQRLREAARTLPNELERNVARAGLVLQAEVRKKLSGPTTRDPFWGKSGGSGETLGSRTGLTRNRITGGRVARIGNVVTTAVGSPDKHVAAHEDGATITAKSGKFLRIPTAAAQTASGMDRNAGRNTVRGLPNLTVIRSKAGKLWIVEQTKRRVTLLYLLVRSVTLRPRKTFAGARAEAEPKVARIVEGAALSVARRANGGS